MSHSMLVMFAIIGRTLTTVACIAGATFLAYYGKEGWGWLIFLGLCIGCYSVSSNDKEEEDE